jgi:hypothetical protein
MLAINELTLQFEAIDTGEIDIDKQTRRDTFLTACDVLRRRREGDDIEAAGLEQVLQDFAYALIVIDNITSALRHRHDASGAATSPPHVRHVLRLWSGRSPCRSPRS